LYELFPDIQGTEIEAMYQDVMNNQQPQTCINQYQLQGEVLFFEISAYPAQDGISVFVKNITDRKQTEEALRHSEKRFRTIFENSSIGIAVVGSNTKLVQTNPFFQQLVGYSGEELARLDYTHITHPDDLPLEQALAQDCIAGIRDSYCLEKRYIRSDGEIIWGNLIISIVRDTDGRFQFAVGMVEDITQRKRVEAELQQYRDRLEDLVKQRTQELLMANQQLQQEISERQKAESAIHFQARLLDLVEHAVIATDLSGTIIYWNRYAERLYGWLATEAMGRNIVETVPSQTSQSQAAEIMSCLSRGESWSGEFWVQRRDGTSFPALVTDSPIHDDRHQLIGIVGISFDITERKQLEEVLRKANAELGITVEERTRDLKSAIERLQEEIVERKRTEVALQQAKEAAEAANRAKSEFLANMSHELRTPLNSILGFAQLMNHQPSLSPQQQKYLGLISRSGEHLLSLINDILSMSKIEAGKITLNETNFDLYRLLQTLEQMFQLKAVNKGLYLIVERTADAPQYVQADESKLRQILINLLENAIKFTESGGIVLRVSGASGQLSLSNGKHQGTTNNGELDFNVSLAREEELRVRALSRDSLPNHQPQTVFFEVEDTGSGIATEELQHLFEPFVQTKTGKKSQSGTGLGLAITRRFVQMMGGTIGISSSLGRGTIVKFHLPLQLTDVVKIPLEQPKRRVISLVPNQPQYRILIVEDNLTNRQLLKELLEPLGFEIQEAENGLEGVALWESWKPHFIWMDMRMPVMDGYEATRQIRAREKQITVDKKWLNCSGSMSGNSATVIVALT
ncbi:MAG TPA: PAS domain S-box protein, partial [Cyanophyceae cyanobacterium]